MALFEYKTGYEKNDFDMNYPLILCVIKTNQIFIPSPTKKELSVDK